MRIKLRGPIPSPLEGEGQGEGEKPAAARCPLTPALSHEGERETGNATFDAPRTNLMRMGLTTKPSNHPTTNSPISQ